MAYKTTIYTDTGPQYVTHFDHTAQEIDDAVGRALTLVRQNILDNAHMYTPHLIDQRQGYVVPPDTPYYSDTGLATQAGTVTAYTTANPGNGTYGTITVSGATYYVRWSAAVRGYVDAGYTVDRWRTNNQNIVVLIGDNGITVINNRDDIRIYWAQSLEKELDPGIYTFSAVINDNELVTGEITFPIKGNYDDAVNFGTNNALRWDVTYGFVCVVGQNNRVVFNALKLEKGEGQTLARQLDDGTWEIIDTPPKPAEALAECQRHSVELNLLHNTNTRLGSGWKYTGRDNQAVIFVDIPVPLRANPTVAWRGNLALLDNVKGTTYQVTGISLAQTNNSTTAICLIVAVDGTITDDVEYRFVVRSDAYASLFLDANL